jgi:hypothetical protein
VAFDQPGPCTPIYSGQRALVIDLGDGIFRRFAPVGGEPRPNFASAGHTYRFIIDGRGAAARFRINDANAADNYGILHIRQLAADGSAPVITPHITPGVAGDHGYYTQPQTVSWDVTDPESGVSSSSGCAPTTVNAETTGTTLTCTATNALGLMASSSVTIKYDGSAPVINSTTTAPDGTNGWYRTAPSVSWTTADDISGVDHTSGCDPTTVTTASAAGSLTCSATNGAGLTGTSTFSYKYDPTAPSVTPTVTGTMGSNGWYRSAPQITWAVADDISGIASTAGCDTVTQTAEPRGRPTPARRRTALEPARLSLSPSSSTERPPPSRGPATPALMTSIRPSR